jgi:hypothetical protein
LAGVGAILDEALLSDRDTVNLAASR